MILNESLKRWYLFSIYESSSTGTGGYTNPAARTVAAVYIYSIACPSLYCIILPSKERQRRKTTTLTIMQWLFNTVRPIMPTANITEFNFVSFSEEKADFSITVAITNPSFLPIPLADVNYFLESQEKRPVYGSLTGLKAIKGHNTRVITVPISISYNHMIDFYSSLKPGTLVPYKARVDVILYFPIIGRFIVPVEKKSEFLMPFVPRIQLREIVTVGKVSNEEVNVKVGFEVENGIGYVVQNNWLEIGAFVNGVKKMVGSLKLEGGKVELTEKGSGFFRVLLCLRGDDIVLGLWEMVRRRKGFVFEGEVDVETPMGQIKSPFNFEL